MATDYNNPSGAAPVREWTAEGRENLYQTLVIELSHSFNTWMLDDAVYGRLRKEDVDEFLELFGVRGDPEAEKMLRKAMDEAIRI
jgi:hypothetical protein